MKGDFQKTLLDFITISYRQEKFRGKMALAAYNT